MSVEFRYPADRGSHAHRADVVDDEFVSKETQVAPLGADVQEMLDGLAGGARLLLPAAGPQEGPDVQDAAAKVIGLLALRGPSEDHEGFLGHLLNLFEGYVWE